MIRLLSLLANLELGEKSHARLQASTISLTRMMDTVTACDHVCETSSNPRQGNKGHTSATTEIQDDMMCARVHKLWDTQQGYDGHDMVGKKASCNDTCM